MVDNKIGDVLRAGLLEKDRQFKEIKDFVSWDYYENWKARNFRRDAGIGGNRSHHRIINLDRIYRIIRIFLV